MIELPKLPEELKEDNNILLWAKFINAERKEEFDMLAEKNPYIESAYQQLQIISQDKQKRLEYEAREKAVRDYNQLIKEAEQRGEERGREAGMKVGEQLDKERTARKLLSMGFEVNAITEITGLCEQEIKNLQI